jgi:multidrug efflux system outer membrane protein
MLSAYASLHSAASEVGIARAARLPSFTLTLFGGSNTDRVSKLFSAKSWVANAMMALTQPIYNFGGLRKQELAAKEAYKQSVLRYEQSFVEALADVEEALANITTSREELERYTSLVESYHSIAQTSYALYINGLSNYLDVIDAERSLYTSQMERANLIAQQYINLINLYKALGGGN